MKLNKSPIRKSLYESEVQLENENKSSFMNWKKSPIRKWKKYAFTKVRLQNGNSSKCKMKIKF